MTRIRFLSLVAGCLLGVLLFPPRTANAQAGSGSSRTYGWNRSIHPSTPAGGSASLSATAGSPTDPYRVYPPRRTSTRSPIEVGSGSLWSEASLFNSPFDFEPVDTYKVGDHIIVKVQDNFRSKEDTRYKNEIKNADIDFNIKRFLWHDFTKINNNPFLDMDIRSKEKYDGTSRGNITSILTLDVQTEVKRILPDGRLLLEGRTSRIIGRDIRQVLITGIVQPEDIDYDTKTVEGSRVLDMQVKWEGNGPGPNVLKPGFFHRFLDYFPLF